MANKILETIVEPSKVVVGSTFLLKIKATRYLTYTEVKQKTYNEIKSYTYSELKGE